MGTKLDEVEADAAKRKVSEQAAANFCAEKKLQYFEVSALTARNVQPMIKTVRT